MASDAHLLLVSASAGHRAQQFRRAAAGIGIRLTLATQDAARRAAEPKPAQPAASSDWGEQAVIVRFDDPKSALEQIKARGPFTGILASGDRSALLASQIAPALNVPFHPLRASTICRDKFAFKKALADAGLPVPQFRRARLDADEAAVAELAAAVAYPCVVKPSVFAGGRGVIRANDGGEFIAAFGHIRRMLAAAGGADPKSTFIQVEDYIGGPEFALEGWMAAGVLQRFALFDKPASAEGPYFADALYITPSRHDTDRRAMIWDLVEAAARAVSLGPGPVHADIRIGAGDSHGDGGGETAYVLQLAAFPIGGYRSRALRFRGRGASGLITLEELLVRGAIGEPLGGWEREDEAAGVWIIPAPGSGVLEEVEGIDRVKRVPGVEMVEINAAPAQTIVGPPDSFFSMGCVLARAATPAAVDAALQEAQTQLHVRLRDTVARRA